MSAQKKLSKFDPKPFLLEERWLEERWRSRLDLQGNRVWQQIEDPGVAGCALGRIKAHMFGRTFIFAGKGFC
jgi:hypothetical protein